MTQWHKLVKFSDDFFRITERNQTRKSISIVCQLPKSSTSFMLSPSYQTISSTSRNWFHTTGTMEPIWVFTTEFGCFQTHSISLWEGTTYHSSCSYYQMVVASSCSFQIYFKVLHFFLSWSILKSHQTVFKTKTSIQGALFFEIQIQLYTWYTL